MPDFTADREVFLSVELRTAFVLLLSFELFIFGLLFTTAGLSEFLVSCLTAPSELVLADRGTTDPLDGFTAELRVDVPDFSLSPEFVLFLTVADFLSALFLCVAVALFLCVSEDLTAERVPTLF